MNANDYQQIMKERGLIESPLSCDLLANAMVMQENIRRMKNRNADSRYVMKHIAGVTVEELIEIYSKEKDEYIQGAIRQAWDEEKTIADLGHIYYTQIEFLKRNSIPTRSLVGEQIPRSCNITDKPL